MTTEEEKQEIALQEIQQSLALFFPEDAYSYTRQFVTDGMEAGEILTQPELILPYIQTALLDDKILEMELDGMTRTYFSRIYDDTPDLEDIEDDESGELELETPEYNEGDYLKLMSHIICLPLEPGMGNVHIRQSQKVMIRFFTSTSAIEVGTFFQEQTMVQDLPVLRLSFPLIGRQVRGARAFRAKVPETMDFLLIVKGKRKKRSDIETIPLNISNEGMSFEIQKDEKSLFSEDEICNIQFYLDGDLHVVVNAKICHLSKIRNKKSIQYCCGVQFDLPTRSLATTIEIIVAAVQRAHMKELSDKSEEIGVTLVR